MGTSFEVVMMLLVTAITNICMLPAIVSLHRQKLIFESFIGLFTMITSFLYHACDSIDAPIWLTEGQWHRLDNIGSIMSFIVWSIYLMDLQTPLQKMYFHYAFLALVLVFQTKNPWDDWNTIIPILLSFLILFLTFMIRRRLPTYNYQMMFKGIGFVVLGVCCFIRGLDDDTDPFRFFHGCWHAFIGVAAYYNFQVLQNDTDRHYNLLPMKRFE